MPLAEHDATRQMSAFRLSEFQFTCPSRSTTPRRQTLTDMCPVSIHVPLAEHDLTPTPPTSPTSPVSIHVPLAEHDQYQRERLEGQSFQFTCPSRSTTSMCWQFFISRSVSIHVPLAEHDTWAVM